MYTIILATKQCSFSCELFVILPFSETYESKIFRKIILIFEQLGLVMQVFSIFVIYKFFVLSYHEFYICNYYFVMEIQTSDVVDHLIRHSTCTHVQHAFNFCQIIHIFFLHPFPGVSISRMYLKVMIGRYHANELRHVTQQRQEGRQLPSSASCDCPLKGFG